MAVAIDLSNEVLHAFANSHRNEMTLIELHKVLSTQFMRITTDEVLRTVRSSSLVNLFNLQPISNDLCLIQLNPKLTLCEAYLQKGCKNKMNCTKLHLCRNISHFSNKPLNKPCQFPHKLSDHANNIVLLRRFNFDTLNEDFLLDLLQFHYKTNLEQSQSSLNFTSKRSLTSQSDRIHLKPPASRPLSQLNKSAVVTDNIKERQLDISIPSERDAPEVDLEIVQLLLATKDIIIEQTFKKQISNEFYRRYTLQVKSKQVVDNLLQNEPVIIYNHIPIKIKRTLRQRDSRIFALQFDTDQKIDNTRLNLYVETLVGKVNPHIFDMTVDGNDEQIYLIRCEQSIDFTHLYKIYSAKNTLQGYRITIKEVYEAESVEVAFVQDSKHPSMTLPRLRQLFGENRWREDVFACVSIRDKNSADIELMNTEITAKWISEVNQIEHDLSLIIHPIIDFIQPLEETKEAENDDDDEEIVKLFPTSSSLSPSNASDDSQKVDNDPNNYIVKPDWRIVLTHPTFGDEYRKYIRENLNISAQIIGSVIQVPNEYIRKELARYTNMFIQKFHFRELVDLDKREVKLIKDNYPRMAHKWQQNTNKTLIAARPEVINELFPHLGSISRQQNRKTNTPAFRYKQSPVMRKQAQQSTPPLTEEPIERSLTPQTQPKTTEDNFHILSYSIENAVYFPFFTSTNSFPDRLKSYLSDTFNIELDIKHVSSTKIILEFKGQHKDVGKARSALTSLFGLLKTKTYSDTNNSCKFIIPDVYRVAQWNLDQFSIVSSCSFSTKGGGTLSIRYFADDPQFGVDEQAIDNIILDKLDGISHQVSTISKRLEAKLEELQQTIQQRPDYGQNICCLYNYQKGLTDKSRLPSMCLYGTKPVVQQLSKEVKKIDDEYKPILCNVQLTSNQVNFLLQICSTDLMKFEKEYEIDGVDLRSKLKSDSSQFLAPKYLHEKFKLLLLELSQTQIVSKDFKCSTEIIHTKTRELNDLALRNRCLLSITPSSSQPTASSRTPKISSGTINVSNGDLTKEQSEVLVVCSTSAQLTDVVIKAAGTQVEQELDGKDMKKNMIDTSAGQLKQAKRLLFLPWTPPATLITDQDINTLRQSISAFIQQAIKYAIQGKFKSIAFPAIGCGGFGVPPAVIATLMIDAVREQLTINPGIQLVITFVVQQPHVFDAFNAKLKPTSAVAAGRARSPSPSRLSSQEKFTLTLTTSNSNIDTAKKVLQKYENILTSSFSN